MIRNGAASIDTGTTAKLDGLGPALSRPKLGRRPVTSW
jgi:hypothetical protein